MITLSIDDQSKIRLLHETDLDQIKRLHVTRRKIGIDFILRTSASRLFTMQSFTGVF